MGPAARNSLIALLLVAVLLSGCSVTNRLFRDPAAEEQAARLLQLQLAVMRFADEYTARLQERIVAFQLATADPAERLEAQSWLVTQATAAVTIAAGSSPELNAIDMLVFATLSRMVIEDRWVGERYGERARGLLITHLALEERIWEQAGSRLSEAQLSELRTSIDAWHRDNPIGRAVPFIHLSDFAIATRNRRARATPSGSIFSFIGIDPLSNLDPAVRELAQTRQLAERAVFYLQRAPKIISMETQRLAWEFGAAPESVALVESVGRLGTAAQETSALAAQFPALLAQERAALVEQLAGVLDEREGRLAALAAELRATLEAGGVTSDSIRETLATFDALMTRFDRQEGQVGRPSSRPFDVTEWTEALRQLDVAAQRLTVLLGDAERQGAALDQLSVGAIERMEELVDRAYRRLVQLILVLVAAGIAGALVYRLLLRRL